MLKIDLPKGVKPINKRERARLLKTINQKKGTEVMKQTHELNDIELLNMEKDIQDTFNYVNSNKESFGENYNVAIDTCNKLKELVDKEKAKRGL